ncbi:methionine--tRNA ligase [Haematomicrobium sanguinis]|uniref:methionine--tRNA ligase n=1 Tax=Haematomicrobium sanguinis TaxID=479106 RepID=UPI000A077F0E|nr:methionine--tRNA ligase [Haematomicrobium sanguinis]
MLTQTWALSATQSRAGTVFRVSSKPKYYITTAIAYPNGVPHLGHAYEYIAADVMARFKRLDGFDVRFLTGTDEHGQKVMQTAEREGVPTQEFVDGLAEQFIGLDKALGITYDRFIRTTDKDHYASAQEVWRRMEANGDIYLDKYEGWYSVRDEAYWADDETELGEDGVRRAKETGTEVSWTEEESYFFRLSRYQDKLLELYQEQPEFAAPSYRFNEVISFVKNGLTDLSISRTSFDWGVPVPGDPKHVMYVWVDALSNYLTGTGFPDWDDEGESLKHYWPADLHVIGKDISRFHAIFWPAFLMSAGLELPQRIIIHGFLMNNGAKLSKSTGNSLDPLELVDTYGLDQLRYFLLREVPYGQDGSYSHDAIVGRMNADLANNFGNLAQRSLSMVAKNLDGVVPTPGAFTAEDQSILDAAHALLDPVRAHMEKQEFSRALEAIWAVLGDANAYFAGQAPWVLRKTDPERMATVLYVTLEVLRVAALLTQAFMPDSTAKLLALLGQAEGEARDVASIAVVLQPGTQLPAPEPVFPKYEA